MTKPKTPKPPRREWTWDENVLAIDTWHRIQQKPEDRGRTARIIEGLAGELGITTRKARGAVQAVGNQRNSSDALAILMHRHTNHNGLLDSRVAAAEAAKVRKRLGLP